MGIISDAWEYTKDQGGSWLSGGGDFGWSNPYSWMNLFDGGGNSSPGGYDWTSAGLGGIPYIGEGFQAQDKMAFEANQAQANRNFQASKQERAIQFADRMSSTAYSRRADDLKKAGLNPILAAGGGASSPTVGVPSGSMATGSMATSAKDSAKLLQSFVKRETQKAEAEISLIKQERNKKKAEETLTKKQKQIADIQTPAVKAEAGYKSDYNKARSGKLDYGFEKVSQGMGIAAQIAAAGGLLSWVSKYGVNKLKNFNLKQPYRNNLYKTGRSPFIKQRSH